MKYADLHLKPNLAKGEQVEDMIRKASELGFSLVGVSLPSKIEQNILRFLRKTCRDWGIDFATRIDLRPESANMLIKQLRNVRRKFEVVAVECCSKNVARQAAKDRRVDLLVFTSANPGKRFFDTAEARLAVQGCSSLEIDFGLFLRHVGFSRMLLFSVLTRETMIAKKFGIPIVISSGADESLELRAPYELISVAGLLEMNSTTALNAISEVPFEIVTRNRRKLSSEYIAEGVYLVRRGNNCD